MALQTSWPGPTAATSTTAARKNLAGLLETNTAGVVRAGLFPSNSSAIVSARADMNVNIAAFAGVAVQFGGPVLLSNDGTIQLSSVLVSPTSGVNYYVVYVKQNESTSPGTDANNNALVGVVVSTSSFAVARSSLPAGALELATVQVPANVTATNAGGVTITQTFLYAAAEGGTVLVRDAAELAAWTPADGSTAYQINSRVFHDRINGAWIARDTGDVALTLNGGYSNASGTPAATYRVRNGMVSLNGRLDVGTGATTNAFTLPAGARPSQQRVTSVIIGGNVVKTVIIGTDGVVTFFDLSLPASDYRLASIAPWPAA